MKVFVFCQKLEPNPIRQFVMLDLASRYAGETPADPPATVQSQLTCHTLCVAEFEAELGRGGQFTWQPHGGHMALHMASHMAKTWDLACCSRTAVR
jgi:hypothetical protein